ncbi:AhpC/TSA family protein [Winogradskyella sp. PG-2]|uniref:AhpC/TSA family protein n=1 Tax=Winogradskyella sp. PG-2 TaxID=754409 RepID=UPI00045875E8|nr:AhpC/TSA family protein [Winogradskyella sp. PG-2]BAO75250.1 disulfide interchange protein [Winogradskyella sp. PG-2]
MKKLIFGITTLLVISCNEKSKEEFSLIGTTNDIENGTVLYLDNKEVLIDSVVIENNSFVFNTKLSKSPLQVVLRTKNFSNYRFLWLENNPMTFNANQSDFRNAIVTGSKEENLSQVLSKETELLPRDERLIKDMEFVSKNPNSVHSAYILSVYSTTWGKEKSKELFEKFSLKNKNSEYGKSISKYIQLNKDPKIGEKYVDFEMKNTNGKIEKLSDFNNKIVLLEFWSSNCGPCRKENPNLVKTFEKYNPNGFEIFAVSQDIKKESWLKAIEKDKLPWNQVSDLKGHDNSASLIYGINGIPDNFLIDENGIIIARNLRGEKLNEKLSELLK